MLPFDGFAGHSFQQLSTSELTDAAVCTPSLFFQLMIIGEVGSGPASGWLAGPVVVMLLLLADFAVVAPSLNHFSR